MALSIVIASIVGDEEVDGTLDTLDDKHDNGLEGGNGGGERRSGGNGNGRRR